MSEKILALGIYIKQLFKSNIDLHHLNLSRKKVT